MSDGQEINKQLTRILIEVGRTQNIENFELNLDTSPNYGDGFVAQFYTGEIQDNDTGNITSVAVKMVPFWEFDYRLLFNNENAFYSTVLPALNHLQNERNVTKPFDNVPKYFCGSMEPKNEYIAMENLKQFGYIMFDKKKYLDKEHLELIFKTYGKFHALSFVLRNKKLEQYQNITKEITDLSTSLIELEGKSITAGVSAAVKALDPEKDKIVYNEVQDLREDVMQTYHKACTYKGNFRCLIHGDGWSNNMLFKYSESGKLLDVKLIDFQFCREDTPIFDLSYFFYSSASKENFDNLDDYLHIYYKSFSDFAQELGGNPNELFPFEILKHEWKENALISVIYSIYLWQIKLLPKADFQVLIHNRDKQDMAENAKIWELLLERMSDTDLFKERTTDILKHAVEYGVLKRQNV